MIADLVAAGWSLNTLGDLPLDSWIEFYGALKSRELERYSMMVSIAHASDPQRLRQSLLNESKRIGAGKEAEWWRSKDKMLSFAKTLPGVSIKAEEVK